MAAKKFAIEKSSAKVTDGEIVAENGSRTTYWSLVSDQIIDIKITGKIPPKDPLSYKLVGKSAPRIDLQDKLTGKTGYITEIRLPGMVHGRVVRPPRPNFSLRKVAIDEVKRMPGVITVVRDGSFLGVITDREEQAIAAAAALSNNAEWDGPALLPAQSELPKRLKNLPSKPEPVIEKGDVAPSAGRRFTASYFRPFLAHAATAPSCAIAIFEGDKLTVWSHTQGVFPARRDMAAAFSVPEEKIRFIHAHAAGCFGHNGADDAAMDAALLARASGRPVRVMWSRQDELAHSPFGSAMYLELAAEIDGSSTIKSYQHDVWTGVHGARPGLQFYTDAGPGSGFMPIWTVEKPVKRYRVIDIPPKFGGGGERNADPIYDFPNKKVTKHLIAKMPLRVSALRSLGAYANLFGIECFMDEISRELNENPVKFRLRHLSETRYRNVIEQAAKVSGWYSPKGGPGKGRGFAFSRYENQSGIIAMVVYVDVDLDSGEVTIDKVVAIVDVGQAINPDGVANQIEGGIIQSFSWALMEEVSYNRDGITSLSWASYPILTLDQTPVMEIHVLDNPDEPTLGVGEIAQGPATAALANAIFDACGARVRELPLRPDKIKAAMKT